MRQYSGYADYIHDWPHGAIAEQSLFWIRILRTIKQGLGEPALLNAQTADNPNYFTSLETMLVGL